jgi:hypothetical protein
MNPYSIAGWISRIENKECRDYYLHSPNYDSLKDKVCETFTDVFFNNNFYDKKNTSDFSKEGSFFWKLKKGQIHISNPHTLTGDVRFIETARVIHIPTRKIGTFLTDTQGSLETRGRQFIKWGDITDYTFASDLKNLEWYFDIKNEQQVYQVYQAGAKVVRNNQTWQYGNEDIHNDKPCVGTVLETVDGHLNGHFIWVKWENGKKRGYNQIYLLLYNDGETTATATTTDTNKVDKLIGKTVIVNNVLPTIVDGKVPTGSVLTPKIKKAIVQNGNLSFREVIV